jgi:hypothetical protein
MKAARWVGAEGVHDGASSGSVQLISCLTASAPPSLVTLVSVNTAVRKHDRQSQKLRYGKNAGREAC